MSDKTVVHPDGGIGIGSLFRKFTGNLIHRHDGQHKKLGFFRFLKNSRGDALLGAVLVITLLTFVLMQPLDAFVVMAKHQMAEKIMHKHLDRIRLEGYLTTANRTSMIDEFNNIGCPIPDPSVNIIAASNEFLGQPRILRSTDPDASRVSLTVTCSPDPQPFRLIRLLGGSEGTTQFKVGGVELSERVHP